MIKKYGGASMQMKIRRAIRIYLGVIGVLLTLSKMAHSQMNEYQNEMLPVDNRLGRCEWGAI
jgi:hypothetical protein